MSLFPKLSKKSTPTFLDTGLANQVLGFLNAIQNMRITPAGAGKVIVGDDSLVIDLSSSQNAQIVQQLQDMQKALAQIQGQVNAINIALKNATISAACNSSGQIVVTLNLSQLP